MVAGSLEGRSTTSDNPRNKRMVALLSLFLTGFCLAGVAKPGVMEIEDDKKNQGHGSPLGPLVEFSRGKDLME